MPSDISEDDGRGIAAMHVTESPKTAEEIFEAVSQDTNPRLVVLFNVESYSVDEEIMAEVFNEKGGMNPRTSFGKTS